MAVEHRVVAAVVVGAGWRCRRPAVASDVGGGGWSGGGGDAGASAARRPSSPARRPPRRSRRADHWAALLEALSAGTRSLSDLAIASAMAASSARFASSSAILLAAASFFVLFRPGCGEEGWSRMTRAPLLRPLVGGEPAPS
ncbi:hypothetical protein QYE76_061916 [Lolium multiflorum]|uniref:Uncharacterized protein n=1 Tax=Lolium multiflorum TaxID=4521 RepID=A0AAD8S343_LOLMU|nr:hypothetical protein QYE76_061916 [Lolium multiflorum]